MNPNSYRRRDNRDGKGNLRFRCLLAARRSYLLFSFIPEATAYFHENHNDLK